MRGLPSCGKSYTSRQLAGEEGVVCELDEFFYAQVGDDPSVYNWSDDLVARAHLWNLGRFKDAVDAGNALVIVDADNRLDIQACEYIEYALAWEYQIEIREPDSPWWGDIRKLLADKQANEQAILVWLRKLSAMSRAKHRAPLAVLIDRANSWKVDVSLEDYLEVSKSASSVGDNCRGPAVQCVVE